MSTKAFGLRSVFMLLAVIFMAGMLTACDDPEGAGGDPGQPAMPMD